MTTLRRPDGANPYAPICGVVAVALMAGVSLPFAMETVKAARRDLYGARCLIGWRGRTVHRERREALLRLGVELTELRHACCTFATLMKRLGENWHEPVMVTITGHVVVVQNGLVFDQGRDGVPWEKSGLLRKRVRCVHRRRNEKD